MMRILFFGDIFGRSGRAVLLEQLSGLKAEFGATFCVANCENLAAGRGITEKTALELLDAGIDCFTSGNHLWDKKEAFPYLAREKRIVKPLNYPKGAIGNPWHILEDSGGSKLAIFCLTGQVYMQPCESPWRHVDDILPVLGEITPCILLDFHAEATGEKRSMVHYLSGRISAVMGTHTHVQTADEEILAAGTAYITDVGMNGSHDSVIGVKKELILQKTLSGMPVRFEAAAEGNQINAVYLELDAETGKAQKIIRIRRKIEQG
jgi:2',3'-cyclic-nucleotide 2'-phosphodiesterase